MIRLLLLAAAFFAGAAAMGWYLTRFHDDRKAFDEPGGGW